MRIAMRLNRSVRRWCLPGLLSLALSAPVPVVCAASIEAGFSPEGTALQLVLKTIDSAQQDMGDRKDSLTFGNKPESYNHLDLYNRIADSINERLMRVTASIGLHSEKCDRNTLINASLFSKSQHSIDPGGF